MTASRSLGATRGIPEDRLALVDKLHDQIEAFVIWALESDAPATHVKSILTAAEFVLQDLWKFEPDERFHTYFKKFRFRKAWYGRRFRCKETGDEFTMPIDVQERRCYSVGGGFVDVGRLDCYSRLVGNIEEVV